MLGKKICTILFLQYLYQTSLLSDNVPLQCLNKTLLYCDNLPTNYTCPPFSDPVFVVLHLQVLHFHVFHLFWSPILAPVFSVHPWTVVRAVLWRAVLL